MSVCQYLLVAAVACSTRGLVPVVTVVPQSSVTVFEGSGTTEYRCNVKVNSSHTITSLLFLLNGNQPTAAMRQDNGIATDLVNSSSAILTISAAIVNNNTKISCQSVVRAVNNSVVLESPISTFLVQGVLPPPSDLVVVTMDSHASFRRLSWTPSFTLNVTNIHPDVIGYRVCICLLVSDTSAYSMNDSCTVTPNTTFDFLNLMVNIQLRVAALNQVGESNFTSETHQKCEADIPIRDFRVVDVIARPGGTYSIILQFEQPVEITCYDVYSTMISNSDMAPRASEALIPTLVDSSTQILQLRGMDTLPPNRNFNIRLDGSRQQGIAQSIFSTFDIQSVHISPMKGTMSVEVGCTFATNTSAMGCQLTVCRNGDEDSCTMVMLSPVNSSTVLSNLELGTYTITHVVEMEQDHSQVIIGDFAMLGTIEAILSPPTTTAVITNTLSPGSLAPRNGLNVGAVVGSVVGAVILVVVVSALLIELIIFLWRRRRKRGEFIPMGDGVRRTTNAQTEPNDVVAENDSKPDSGAKVMGSIYRPTSPFYTHVKKDHHSTYDSLEAAPPELPPKKGSKHSSVISSSSDPHSVMSSPQFRVQLHHCSQEQVQLAKNSTSNSNLTYAELDHHHTPVRMTRPSSSSAKAVLYSEIQVKEIPPVLPRKKQKSISNAGSCTSVNRHSAGSAV